MKKAHQKKLTMLGKRLKIYRFNSKLKMVQMARKCKVSQGTLSKIENGKVNICFETILNIEDGIGVKFGDLLT